MPSFLKLLAQDLIKNYSNDFINTIIIFPNKRAGLFLSDELSKLIKEPQWMPKIMTLSEYISSQIHLQTADEVTLVTKLYKAYINSCDSKESFDEFYYWGKMLISDFDDVDKYLVNAKDLFSNLQSLKEIEQNFSYLDDEEMQLIKQFWGSFSILNQSDEQKKFVNIWGNLYATYSTFRKSLLTKNLCYEGLAQRLFCEQLDSNKSVESENKNIIIAGFNALNLCEKKIFSYYRDNNNARFYWDYDSYYTDDKKQEAGLYIRENLKQFPNTIKKENFKNFLNNDKQVDIISIASAIGQAKLIPTLLQEFDEQIDRKTGIILCDESMLLPALSSIPDFVGNINITMGYPAQNSSIAAFIQLIQELQTSSKKGKDNNNNNNNTYYYYKEVLALLNHKLIRNSRNIDIEKITKEINSNNNIYISAKGLQLNTLTKAIFINKIDSIPDYLKNILRILLQTPINKTNKESSNEGSENLDDNYKLDNIENKNLDLNSDENINKSITNSNFNNITNNSISKKNTSEKLNAELNEDKNNDIENLLDDVPNQINEIEKEFIFSLYTYIQNVQNSFETEGIKPDNKLYMQIVIKLLNTTSIPFSGEPLKGMQLMGLMESRMLDFNNLIILSANEGVLPKNNLNMSFIPYNLRKGFKMPTPENKDALFAYYFYRLLQRSKKIKIVYNSAGKSVGSNEKSRFLLQLEYESGLKIKKRNFQNHILSRKTNSISIPKDKDVMERLEQMAKEQISPSAINNYLECPLRFYFNNVVRVKSLDKADDKLNAKFFGTIFHDTMHELYSKVKDRKINSDFLDHLLKNQHLIIEEISIQFNVTFNNKGSKKSEDTNNNEDANNLINSGTNELLLKAIKSYVISTIKYDMQFCPFEIMSMEQKYLYPIDIFDGKKKIMTGGYIDRVDNVNNCIRILDYKTGRDDTSVKDLVGLFDKTLDKRNKAAMQTLLYCYIYQSATKDSHIIYPVIYSIKDLINKDYNPNLKIDKEFLEDFEYIKDEFISNLKKILEEIYNYKIPFTQTEIESKCEYCDFSSICNK